MKDPISGKKTIAFVSSNTWTMYNFRREVLQAILQQGHEVLIIAGEDDYAALLVTMGCKFEAVGINNRSLNPVYDVSLFKRLKKVYQKYRPHLIFHYVIKPNIYGTLAAHSLGIPSIAVITGLGYAFNRNNLLQLLIKNLYAFSLRYAREVWCLNQEDAAFFSTSKIVAASKIRLLPGEGVDTGYFLKTNFTRNDRFSFIMSSRMLKSKGVAEYVHAAILLKRKAYMFDCYLMGAVEDHPDGIPSAQIESWQSENVIRYLGFCDDVRPYLSKADCFVFPSYYNEGLPRSLMEACSMELPVITTRTTGCRELIEDNVNGFLCIEKDPVDLAAKMEQMILLDEHTRHQMGKHGRSMVEAKCSMDLVLGIYRRTLQAFFN